MLCAHIIYYRRYDSKINPNLELLQFYSRQKHSLIILTNFFLPPEMAQLFVFQQTGKAWKILIRLSPQRDSDQICS